MTTDLAAIIARLDAAEADANAATRHKDAFERMAAAGRLVQWEWDHARADMRALVELVTKEGE